MEEKVRHLQPGKQPAIRYLNGRISWVKRKIKMAAENGLEDSNSQARLHELLNMKAHLAGATRWEGALALRKQEVIKRLRRALSSLRSEDRQDAEAQLVQLLMDLDGKTRQRLWDGMHKRTIRIRTA